MAETAQIGMTVLERGFVHDENALVKVKRLKKYFPVKQGLFARVSGHVKAVDNISFDIREKGIHIQNRYAVY